MSGYSESYILEKLKTELEADHVEVTVRQQFICFCVTVRIRMVGLKLGKSRY